MERTSASLSFRGYLSFALHNPDLRCLTGFGLVFRIGAGQNSRALIRPIISRRETAELGKRGDSFAIVGVYPEGRQLIDKSNM